MVGNATEEGILRDLKNPAHRDRPVWPLVVALVMLVGGWWVFGLLSPLGLPVWAAALITAALLLPVGIAAAVLMHRYVRRRIPGSAASAFNARKTRQEGLATEIAAARASGAFDRWESPGREKDVNA